MTVRDGLGPGEIGTQGKAKEHTLAEITSLLPGVWLVETELEDFHVRGAVLVGAERAVVWDTLARPADMKGITEISSGLPLSVIYSHGDWDHVWGTGGLSTIPEEIIAHNFCLPRFTSELPATLREKRQESPGSYGDVLLAPPTRVFETNLHLDLGGASLELCHLPGHTRDTIVGFVPEWGLFLAGDAVETPLPFLNPGSPIRSWAENLEKWAEALLGWERLEGRKRPPLVIPSHGRVGGPELLMGNARYLRDLMAGREPEVGADLSSFYRETHANNLALSGKNLP